MTELDAGLRERLLAKHPYESDIDALAPVIAAELAKARAEGAAEVRAQMESLADLWEREAEPYLYGGSRYGKSSDTLFARADCRHLDAERLRHTPQEGGTP